MSRGRPVWTPVERRNADVRARWRGRSDAAGTRQSVLIALAAVLGVALVVLSAVAA